MKALDRAGSIFLRSILKRMKVLGLNQSALARRMNVSRAYVSKVFAGDVNISFHTACRFAKALEMDFMPGLMPKTAKVEQKARTCVVLAAVLCLFAPDCSAEVVQTPSWLPEDQRFEVSGTSNEIAQIEQTLVQMREAFHPKLRMTMKESDIGPTLSWIVHVSLPSVTNDTSYFDSYKKPIPCSALDASLLTNRAARLSYVPPIPRVRIVYDAAVYYSKSRPVPGVDYPGVDFEDADSTPYMVKIVLRAPKRQRTFKLDFTSDSERWKELTVKIVPLVCPWAMHYSHIKSSVQKDVPGYACLGLDYCALGKRARTAVFAKSSNGCWGPPAFIEASADPLCRHKYDKRNIIESIDYGSWRDVYRLDGQDRIIGFERIQSGMFCGDDYSNVGEKIIETHPGDMPKIARKVAYSVKDGKLTYAVSDDDIHYKNEPMRFRNY